MIFSAGWIFVLIIKIINDISKRIFEWIQIDKKIISEAQEMDFDSFSFKFVKKQKKNYGDPHFLSAHAARRIYVNVVYIKDLK